METHRAMTFRWMPISEITPSPLNPKARTDPKRLQDLLRDIAIRGIVEPLMVDKRGVVIEGHRRLACAKALGLSEVPCVIEEGDANEIHKATNELRDKWAAVDWLGRYLAGGSVGREPYRQITAIERLMGRGFLDRMLDKQIGYRVIKTAKRAAHYCGVPRGNGVFLCKALEFMLEHRQTRMIEYYIDKGVQPPSVLYEAIMTVSPVVFTARVGSLAAGEVV